MNKKTFQCVWMLVLMLVGLGFPLRAFSDYTQPLSPWPVNMDAAGHSVTNAGLGEFREILIVGTNNEVYCRITPTNFVFGTNTFTLDSQGNILAANCDAELWSVSAGSFSGIFGGDGSSLENIQRLVVLSNGVDYGDYRLSFGTGFSMTNNGDTVFITAGGGWAISNLVLDASTVVIGNGATSFNGVAIGVMADASAGGTAVGGASKATGTGAVSIGYWSSAGSSNIAIGPFANASVSDTITIGRDTTNDISGSARLRGTLYLDGGTGVLYRSTFGSGDWTALGGGGTEADTLQSVMDRGNWTTNPLVLSNAYGVVIRGGYYDGGLSNIVVGDGATCTVRSVAIGVNADGGNDGAAIGYGASTRYGGVAIGEGANGLAIGYLANAYWSGSGVEPLAMGRLTAASAGGITLGESSSSAGGVSIGPYCRTYQAGDIAIGLSVTAESLSTVMGMPIFGGECYARRYSMAFGFNARAQSTALAFGPWSAASNGAMSIGYNAVCNRPDPGSGDDYNNVNTNGRAMAIGIHTRASGSNSCALGIAVSNEVPESTMVRGSLYLDGGTGVFTRSTFGTGAWTGFHTDGTNLFFVNSTGAIEQITGL